MPSDRICHFVAAALGVAAAAASTVSALAQTPPEPGRIARPTLVIRGNAEEDADRSPVGEHPRRDQGQLRPDRGGDAFRNPNARVLEGELQFPLLDGQQVIGFAMDIDGKLRDAVPVDKARGQMMFEEITRRGVDPRPV